MVELERIYVGGVDPPRLTVEELMSRITSDVRDKVEMQNISISSTYCHFNAKSLESGVSALEIIRKLYNNVKWKGCKIKVEGAKPHYLERLAKEREERLNLAKEINEENERNDLNHEPILLPRHLKIRRGYGEESWKVDTKPCEVTDWSTFRKMRKRFIEKQKESREKKNHVKKNSTWNRAVLFRFQDEAFSSQLHHPRSFESENKVSDDSSTATSSSSSSSNLSQSDKDQKQRKKSSYAWSDSSDESDDEDDEHIKIDVMKDVYDKEILENKVNNKRGALAESNNDSDDNSSDDDDDDGVSSVKDDHDQINDVQTNLNILAQIFPDLEGTKAHAEINKNDSATVKGSSEMRSGWTDMGQMVRFDPTQLSSEKFIVDGSVSETATEDEEVEMKGGDNDSANSDTSSKGSVAREQEDKELNNEAVTSENGSLERIYEQGMLEQVFKENREEVPRESENLSSDARKQESAFSFSFQLPTTTNDTVVETIVQLPEANKVQALPSIPQESIPLQQEQPKPKRQRRGLFFPDKALDFYVDFFYSQGDGSRIMNQGLQAYREDPKVQESWASQRRSLTQDWRRKHKYAVSHKRKRFGH